MIHCLIVDDEQHALDILTHYVHQAPQLHLEACFSNPIEALEYIQRKRVDLIFLDIHMPELSGIDLVRTIQGKCRVILTTAYPEYALEGYELHVIDYLLKPIRLPRFLAAVQKAAVQIQVTREQPPDTAENDFIFVKTESKGKLLKIELAEIDYIEGMKNYVAIHSGGKKTLVNTTLKNLEGHLPGERFMRVHKSFIIPLQRMLGIEGNLLRLRGVAQPIAIGENYKAAIIALVQHKLIG